VCRPLANLRVRARHAVVARHCDFQAAAQRRAMNRHHHGFRAIFNSREQGIQSDVAILLAGRDLAEFFDVGSSDERATASDQHSGANARVGHDLFDRFPDPFRDAGTERVDRRIVDGDDGNVVIASKLD
jgi:hypothetical protein